MLINKQQRASVTFSSNRSFRDRRAKDLETEMQGRFFLCADIKTKCDCFGRITIELSIILKIGNNLNFVPFLPLSTDLYFYPTVFPENVLLHYILYMCTLDSFN